MCIICYETVLDFLLKMLRRNSLIVVLSLCLTLRYSRVERLFGDEQVWGGLGGGGQSEPHWRNAYVVSPRAAVIPVVAGEDTGGSF